MLLYPGSKINLGLHVGALGADGYHVISSVFLPVSFSDTLEVDLGGKGFRYSGSGYPLAGKVEDNLCYKAWKLICSEYGDFGVEVQLNKVVPIGSGLGGGSADAVQFLKAALSGLGKDVSEKQVMSWALKLGSDCPFFVKNMPALVSGRGEIITPHDPGLKGLYYQIVCPKQSISTSAAFHLLDQRQAVSASTFVPTSANRKEWKDKLLNDFEEIAISQAPEIKEIKETLYKENAEYASLTGSGSAVFGIFKQEPKVTFPYQTFVGQF